MKWFTGFSALISLFSFTANAFADEATCPSATSESVSKDPATVSIRLSATDLDLRQAFEVNDDQEGINSNFSIDGVNTIITPIELASNTAPNKIGH